MRIIINEVAKFAYLFTELIAFITSHEELTHFHCDSIKSMCFIFKLVLMFRFHAPVEVKKQWGRSG